MGLEHVIAEWFAAYGLLGMFFAAIIANATILLPIPLDIVVFGVAGFAQNVWYVLALGFVAGMGAGIGEMTAYLLGLLGISTAERILGRRISNLEDYQAKLQRRGMVFIFIASFTPIPFDVIGIIAGLIRYDWRKFFLAGVAGKIVRYEFVALAGFYGIQFFRDFFLA